MKSTNSTSQINSIAFIPKTRIASAKNSLSPVYYLEFAKDIVDIVADRLAAYHQFIGNILITCALCHEFKNLALPDQSSVETRTS